MLAGEIKKVEWEDLDPKQYPELFRAVVADLSAKDKEDSNEVLQRLRDRINKKEFVFRRARLELKGYPTFWNENSNTPAEVTFHIVQYGPDVTSPKNPDPVWSCKSLPGRVKLQEYPVLKLFLVTADMHRIYDRLADWFGGFGDNIWLIKGYPYAETYFKNGDVRLSELRIEYPVHLEPVCMYHYTQTASKEK